MLSAISWEKCFRKATIIALLVRRRFFRQMKNFHLKSTMYPKHRNLKKFLLFSHVSSESEVSGELGEASPGASPPSGYWKRYPFGIGSGIGYLHMICSEAATIISFVQAARGSPILS